MRRLNTAAPAYDEPYATPSPSVGSIVVKEKEAQLYRADGPERKWVKARNGVGGVIKRSAGYDSAHGDWEYFYFEDPAKIESGKIASCVQCHSGASAKVYVFGGWATKQ